jgi:hypothetical protein
VEVKDESASAHEAGMVAPVISHVPESIFKFISLQTVLFPPHVCILRYVSRIP